MDDLISRQAAIDAIDAACMKYDISPYFDDKRTDEEKRIDWWEMDKVLVKALICDLPSVHPEIICCKDCKHRMPYDWMFSEVWKSKNMDDYPEDEIGCAYCDMNMSANDFCSYAERRTNE